MPYRKGNRLAGETASKLGHLDVIKSDLVNELIEKFEDQEMQIESPANANWESIDFDVEELRLIFAVDGSKQTVRSDLPPFKEVSFVKTAILRLDKYALDKLDQLSPHPMALRDIMSESAIYHATVFPLKGVKFEDLNNYHAVRRIIYDSLKDESIDGEVFETLKWLSYRKWTDKENRSPSFQCPHCLEEIEGLPFDSDEGTCNKCDGHLYLSDMIGFHLEMVEDMAPESLATTYMLIHETLLLFTGIRFFWEREKFKVLANSLFLKDGPLTLRGQYSKLVIPIREYLEFSKDKGVPLHIAGQEKTGAFVDHLDLTQRTIPKYSVFIPDNDYIRQEVQHRPERAEPYGYRTNFGNKVFCKYEDYSYFVLSVPTGEYRNSQSLNDLIGVKRILKTLPSLISYKHECALVPIELANGVASLSSYPSATVLKLFADI